MTKPRDYPFRIAAWRRKFGDAFDGLLYGIQTQSSLQVQYLCAIAIVGIAAILSVEVWRWAVLLACIAIVLSAEYFNSAIEQLVRAINPGHNSEIAKVLHLAAAAVLIASLLATAIGIITLASPLQGLLQQYLAQKGG